MKYRIGDTVIDIEIDSKWMHPTFEKFQCEQSANASMRLEEAKQEDLLQAVQVMVGQIVLMESEDIGVYEGAMGIDLVFPKHKYLTSIQIDKGYHSAQMYLTKDPEGQWVNELYESLKQVVYLALEQNGRFILDSSSMKFKGHGIIISADEDNLFAKLCQEKGIGSRLNDNMNVCGIQDGRIYVYGTPWSGPEFSQPERTPLGGIVFIKKSDNCEMIDIPEDKKQLLMLVRCMSPLWREGLLDQCLSTIKRVEPSLWIRQLKTQKDEQGADELLAALDEKFGKKGEETV